MKEDVRLHISGLRSTYTGDEFDNEDISVMVSGKYEFVDGVHKISYEEIMDEVDDIINNTIYIDDTGMKIKKKGATNSLMNFSRNENSTSTKYSTPYGDIFMRLSTHSIDIKEDEDRIIVDVDYSLSIEDELLSSSKIRVDVSSK